MITKKQLNDLGFHRQVGSNNFYKKGYCLWTLECEPGNVYVKLAIKKDTNEKYDKEEWTYLYDIEELGAYLYKEEKLPHLENCLSSPFVPELYNHNLFHPSDSH